MGTERTLASAPTLPRLYLFPRPFLWFLAFLFDWLLES